MRCLQKCQGGLCVVKTEGDESVSLSIDNFKFEYMDNFYVICIAIIAFTSGVLFESFCKDVMKWK